MLSVGLAGLTPGSHVQWVERGHRRTCGAGSASTGSLKGTCRREVDLAGVEGVLSVWVQYVRAQTAWAAPVTDG